LVFQDGGRRHLGLIKFQTFNGRTAPEARAALACQIWSKSVKTRRSYGEFSIFQYGGRRHLEFLKFWTAHKGRNASPWIFGFLKFQTFNGRTAQDGQAALTCIRVEMRRRAKFGRNRSKRGGDMAIFRFFNMAAAAILDL